MAFSNRLREERKRRTWSQAQLAELLGTTPNTVSAWERGKNIPVALFREKIAVLFQLTQVELELAGEEPPISAPSLDLEIKAPLPAPAPSIRDPYLPARPATFSLVGRDALLMQLVDKLTHVGKGNILALHGLAGCGKTSLIQALLHHPMITQVFPDGVLWAGLGPQAYSGEHIQRWGRLLEVSLPREGLKQEEAILRLRHALAKRRVLIVLDDVWRVEDAHVLQIAGSHCTSIITTRSPLLALQLAGLEDTCKISELDQTESRELLARFVPQIVERYPDMMRELIQLAGGLPLSLVLMGKYLQMQSYSGQSRRIRHALASLQEMRQRLHLTIPAALHGSYEQDAPETTVSLNAILAVTDQRLSANAQKGLRAFALFPPKPLSFSEEAALALLPESERVLDELCDIGLLESAGQGRYTMHQTIADYAHLHLQDLSRFTLSFIRYALTYTRTHMHDVQALERESPLLFKAIEMAHQMGKHQQLLEICQALQPFLVTRGLYSIAQQYFTWSLEAAEQLGNEQALIFFLLHIGKVLEKLGSYQMAEQHLRRGLLLAQRKQNHAQTDFLRLLGVIQSHHGHWQEAEVLYRRGLILAEQWNDLDETFTLLSELGALMLHGNPTDADPYIERGFSLMPLVHDPLRKSAFLRLAGSRFNAKGNYKEAEACFLQALGLAKQEGSPELTGSLLRHLGLIARRRGAYTQASDYYHESLALSRQIGHREQIALRLITLAVVHIAQGKDEEAERELHEALEHAQALQHGILLTLCLINLGELSYRQRTYSRAEQLYQEALLTQQQRAASEEFLFYIYQGLTRTELQLQKLDQASAYLQLLLALAQRQEENTEVLCLAFETQGEYALFIKDYAQARQAFSQMLQHVPKEEKYLKTSAQYGLAHVAACEGHWAQAQAHGKRAVRQWRTMGHRRAHEAEAWLKQFSKTAPNVMNL